MEVRAALRSSKLRRSAATHASETLGLQSAVSGAAKYPKSQGSRRTFAPPLKQLRLCLLPPLLDQQQHNLRIP